MVGHDVAQISKKKRPMNVKSSIPFIVCCTTREITPENFPS